MGKVRSEGLEGKAGLHTVGSTGQTRFPDLRDELLSSIHNKIKKTEVVTGIRKDGNLEVLEGLNANEKVVKEGLARLADGMTVRPLTK